MKRMLSSSYMIASQAIVCGYYTDRVVVAVLSCLKRLWNTEVEVDQLALMLARDWIASLAVDAKSHPPRWQHFSGLG